jgi:aryl-alcohol dehydrogenase-like predicted oxidoreductase
MEQRHLGRSGLIVSRLGLGTLGWGSDTGPDEAAAQLVAFVEAGGTLVDTADYYGDGASEQLLGQLLRQVVAREDLVVATRTGAVPGGPPNLSRRHLLGSLDASLAVLDLDHVDLWQLDDYDRATPVEETLAAADEAVASGRTRYVGVSNCTAWQLAKASTWQRAWPGRVPIVSVQTEYSLLQRGAEAELLPAAADLGIGLLARSPLGRGVLTGKYRRGIPADSRAAATHLADCVRPCLDDRAQRVVESVATAAAGLGVSPLTVALSWLKDRPGVVAPIVGPRGHDQLLAILGGEEVSLPGEIQAALDDVSRPGGTVNQGAAVE